MTFNWRAGIEIQFHVFEQTVYSFELAGQLEANTQLSTCDEDVPPRPVTNPE